MPFLSEREGQKWAEALLQGYFLWAPQGSGTDAYRPQPRLLPRPGRVGGGVSLAPPKSVIVNNRSSNPFLLVPQARLGAWPPVCWQDWVGVGGRQGNFKLSGQNVKFTHEFTQQKEGEEARAGTPHARVLSVCLSPPSSPTLLLCPRPKQA